jgi:hypothetical protein
VDLVQAQFHKGRILNLEGRARITDGLAQGQRGTFRCLRDMYGCLRGAQELVRMHTST